jgi:hypothetical protein
LRTGSRSGSLDQATKTATLLAFLIVLTSWHTVYVKFSLQKSIYVRIGIRVRSVHIRIRICVEN